MSNVRQRSAQVSEKLKEIGSWFRETIIITVNEIADAVMEDMPDDLVDPSASVNLTKQSEQETEGAVCGSDYFGHRVYSSSDTGSTQSCDFDDDYLNSRDEFPTTLDRTSLISRINTLYTSGFGLGGTILNENRRVVSKSCEENDDIVLVVEPETTEEIDDSGWIKL